MIICGIYFSDRKDCQTASRHGQNGHRRVRSGMAIVRRGRRDEDVQERGGGGRDGGRSAQGSTCGEGHHRSRSMPLLLQPAVQI